MVRRLAPFALLVLLGGCSFHVSESNFIRPVPDAEPSTLPIEVDAAFGIRESRHSIDAADGAVLHAVLLQQPQARMTVLYFGANMFRISSGGATIARRLLPFGVNLLMVDHRGSGGSTGTPAFALLEQDALAAYDFARDRLAVPADRLFVHGMSLGSFMAGHVALHRPVAGLVLEGSGSTVEEWVQQSIPWYGKPIVDVSVDAKIADKGNLRVVEQSTAPLLILAGRRDEQAPWIMSQSLFDAALSERKQLVVVAKAGHMDILDWPESTAAYGAFVDMIATTPAPAAP